MAAGPRRRGRVAVVAPYWDFWAGSTPFDLRASRDALLAAAVAHVARHADVVATMLVDADNMGQVVRTVVDAQPEVLLVLQTMATPPSVTLRMLDDIGSMPLVVWTGRSTGSVAASFDHADVTAEGATVGTPMLTAMLVRTGRPFDMVTVAFDDPHIDVALGGGLIAAIAARRLSRARIGRIGRPIAGYDCVDLDAAMLRADVGAEVIELGPAEFNDAHRAVPPSDVDAAVRRVRASYRVDPDLPDQAVGLATRAWLALETIVERHQLDAGAFNCHVPEIRLGPDVGIAPCFALGCLTTSGVPWTCAGDVVTAVAMLAVKSVGGAAFYHELEAFDATTGAFVQANSGEHDTSLAPPGDLPELRVNPWYPGGASPSACVRTSPASGPATLVGFAQISAPIASHRLVVAAGEFVDGGYPNTGTSNAAFRFVGEDPVMSWETWCRAGSNHHGVATPGDHIASLARVAAHLDLDVARVRAPGSSS